MKSSLINLIHWLLKSVEQPIKMSFRCRKKEGRRHKRTSRHLNFHENIWDKKCFGLVWSLFFFELWWYVREQKTFYSWSATIANTTQKRDCAGNFAIFFENLGKVKAKSQAPFQHLISFYNTRAPAALLSNQIGASKQKCQKQNCCWISFSLKAVSIFFWWEIDD